MPHRTSQITLSRVRITVLHRLPSRLHPPGRSVVFRWTRYPDSAVEGVAKRVPVRCWSPEGESSLLAGLPTWLAKGDRRVVNLRTAPSVCHVVSDTSTIGQGAPELDDLRAACAGPVHLPGDA